MTVLWQPLKTFTKKKTKRISKVTVIRSALKAFRKEKSKKNIYKPATKYIFMKKKERISIAAVLKAFFLKTKKNIYSGDLCDRPKHIWKTNQKKRKKKNTYSGDHKTTTEKFKEVKNQWRPLDRHSKANKNISSRGHCTNWKWRNYSSTPWESEPYNLCKRGNYRLLLERESFSMLAVVFLNT